MDRFIVIYANLSYLLFFQCEIYMYIYIRAYLFGGNCNEVFRLVRFRCSQLSGWENTTESVMCWRRSILTGMMKDSTILQNSSSQVRLYELSLFKICEVGVWNTRYMKYLLIVYLRYNYYIGLTFVTRYFHRRSNQSDNRGLRATFESVQGQATVQPWSGTWIVLPVEQPHTRRVRSPVPLASIGTRYN